MPELPGSIQPGPAVPSPKGSRRRCRPGWPWPPAAPPRCRPGGGGHPAAQPGARIEHSRRHAEQVPAGLAAPTPPATVRAAGSTIPAAFAGAWNGTATLAAIGAPGVEFKNAITFTMTAGGTTAQENEAGGWSTPSP